MADSHADDLLNQLLTHISNEYDKSPGYITYDVLKSVALVLSGQLDKLDGIEALLNVDNLTGSLLETFVYQRKGITRTAATKATGVLIVTGNGAIQAGDIFETPSGIQFSAASATTISGSGQVSVICTTPGIVGNVPVAQITQMPVTIPGITSVTNPEPTHDGYEAETDDNLRARYYVAVRTPPTSGNIYHYLQWATEVPGVGAAKIFPVERGLNTVEVVIIDQEKQPASSVLVSQVQEHIDPDSKGLGYGEAPIGAKCYVISATAREMNVNVSITKSPGYSDTQVKTNLEKSIREYLKSIAFQQNYVSFARIGEAVLNSEGVKDYAGLQVNGATENPAVADKEVAVLGVITIA